MEIIQRRKQEGTGSKVRKWREQFRKKCLERGWKQTFGREQDGIWNGGRNCLVGVREMFERIFLIIRQNSVSSPSVFIVPDLFIPLDFTHFICFFPQTRDETACE